LIEFANYSHNSLIVQDQDIVKQFLVKKIKQKDKEGQQQGYSLKYLCYKERGETKKEAIKKFYLLNSLLLFFYT